MTVKRIPLLSPLGRGTVMVAASRVDRYKANGWTELPEPKPAPRRRKQQTDDDK